MKAFLVLFLSGFFFFAGCVSNPIQRGNLADQIALDHHFEKQSVPTDYFLLRAFSKIQAPGKPVRFYVEGDGYAFVTRSRPSGDPTPRDPLVLRLAVQDPSPNVVYLARPCQYVGLEADLKCDEYYWTQGRFSKEAVESVNQAVTYFVNKLQAPSVELVGYSGGGTVAVLIAAVRHDVKSLRTIAGNLNPGLVTRIHGVTPLPETSLDPMAVISKVEKIPQIHFTGARDSIIPLEVAESYADKFLDKRCVTLQSQPGFSHHDGWSDDWLHLLTVEPACF